MTVAELIAELEKLPADIDVLHGAGCDGNPNIDRVEVRPDGDGEPIAWLYP